MHTFWVLCLLFGFSAQLAPASESRSNGLWLGLYSAPYPSLWSLGYRREIRPYLHALGALGHYPFLTSVAFTAGASVRVRHPTWAISPFVGGGANASYQSGAIAVGFTPWLGSGFKFSYPVAVGVEWINSEGLFVAWTNQYPLGATSTPSLISGIEVGFLF